MKFIHAADIHLDSPLRGLEQYEGAPAQALRGATRLALKRLVDLAIEESVAFVLLAGDLYDGDWRDYNTGLFFTQQMGRLQAADIRVFVIAGNHDAASQITTALRPPANVQVFATRAPETRLCEDLGVAIHGQGFATRAVSADLSQGYASGYGDLFNIGLLHTSLNGRPGHADYAPCSLDGLRSRGYQYWALGHVHRHEIVAEDPWVVFPGNIQGRHARETGAKGCCLVDVADGRVLRVEHRPLDPVRWTTCSVDLTDVATLEEALDRVGRSLSAAVDGEGRLVASRVRLWGPCALHDHLRAQSKRVVGECRALANLVAPDAIWVEKVLIDTRGTRSEAEALARDATLGALFQAIRELQGDPAALGALGDDFADLQTRLPAPSRDGEEALDLRDADYLRACLEDVQALLLERLLAPGERA